MRLIHSHRELEFNALERLLDVLDSDPSYLVLREHALQSCNHTKVLNQLGKHATVYFLADHNIANLPENLRQQVISYTEFVQLCIDADQVIGWN